MSDPLAHFGLVHPPFADGPHAADVIGTRSLRKVVARIQAALRDGHTRVGVQGVAGVGKSSLAASLPKLFAGRTRVARVADPTQPWPELRSRLAGDWQLTGEKLSKAGLLEASRVDRLVLVVDRGETAPGELLHHLDVLQDIRDEHGDPVVTALLFIEPAEEEGARPPLAFDWLEKSRAPLLEFEPLTSEAVADYIERRLHRAGYRGAPIFTLRASLAIHTETRGLPAQIDRLCDQLLTDAAARQLRSIDEPFVRSRQSTLRALADRAPGEVEPAWDDADHHPRETASDPILLDEPIGGDELDFAHEPVEPTDPDLEAYLSAPPSAAELRAIRGSWMRRNARPLALGMGAVVLGGLVLALVLGQHAQPSAAVDESASAEAAGSHRADANAIDGGGHPRSLNEANPDAAVRTQPLLGRVHGPITGVPVMPARASTQAPGSSGASTSPTAARPAAQETPLDVLPRAGDLDDLGFESPPAAVTSPDESELEVPDLRPEHLRIPTSSEPIGLD